MRILLCMTTIGLMFTAAGCGTIQSADKQAGYSYRTEVRERNKTDRAKQSTSDAVRMAAVQAAITTTVRRPEDSPHVPCPKDSGSKQAEVIFTPPSPATAGVHINLTGASTGDIRLIIQSPGAADQSANGSHVVPDTPAPPQSVVTGMSNGLLDLLGKATPWAIGGYALGEFADAFRDGMHNAGDRDNSVDESVSIDQSIGGDKIDMPALE